MDRLHRAKYNLSSIVARLGQHHRSPETRVSPPTSTLPLSLAGHHLLVAALSIISYDIRLLLPHILHTTQFSTLRVVRRSFHSTTTPRSWEGQFIRFEVISGKDIDVPSQRIPAGIYISINIKSEETLCVAQNITGIRASFELDRMLGNGEVIGLQTLWDELIGHGNEPFGGYLYRCCSYTFGPDQSSAGDDDACHSDLRSDRTKSTGRRARRGEFLVTVDRDEATLGTLWVVDDAYSS
ncbi:hypothetical protein DEU56DRAFT_756843 [Suillus clintonianus]|uniref:uncharacterized protein n=1 Tax=Suillus clintonianus TaxID=1904413 RepID=UPI001B862FD0|nr:uncharacterized protein DEU56DRAFT_756843 [Suillus clintonianus]KAG2134816.1 hypothetical protein DEU56DRAFT_756843 [Suillus clintonianus]